MKRKTTGKGLGTRFDEAVEEAQNAFWAKIAKEFPEVEARDLPSEAQVAFEEHCKEAVRIWLMVNHPQWVDE